MGVWRRIFDEGMILERFYRLTANPKLLSSTYHHDRGLREASTIRGTKPQPQCSRALYCYHQLNDQIPILGSKQISVAGKMGYALTPYEVRPAAHYGAWTYAIPSQSKNPEAAYLFLQWAMSKDTQLKWTLMGGIPSRESTFKDRQVRSVEFMPATLDALKVSDCSQGFLSGAKWSP